MRRGRPQSGGLGCRACGFWVFILQLMKMFLLQMVGLVLALAWARPTAAQSPDEIEHWLKLAEYYELGTNGYPEDSERSNSYLRRAASAGSPAAHHLLGIRYATGMYMEKDVKKGQEYLEMAANRDYVPAFLTLMRMHTDTLGRGFLPPDQMLPYAPDKAVNYARRAALANNAEGAWFLGRAYMLGYGTAEDPQAAMRWMTHAADSLDYPQAMLALGNWYYYGDAPEGVNTQKAISYYERAEKHRLLDIDGRTEAKIGAFNAEQLPRKLYDLYLQAMPFLPENGFLLRFRF